MHLGILRDVSAKSVTRLYNVKADLMSLKSAIIDDDSIDINDAIILTFDIDFIDPSEYQIIERRVLELLDVEDWFVGGIYARALIRGAGGLFSDMNSIIRIIDGMLEDITSTISGIMNMIQGLPEIPFFERDDFHGVVDFYFANRASINSSRDLIKQSRLIDLTLHSASDLSGIDRNDFELVSVSAGSSIFVFGIPALIDPATALGAIKAVTGIVSAATGCVTLWLALKKQKESALGNPLVDCSPADLDRMIQEKILDHQVKSANKLVQSSSMDIDPEQQNRITKVIKLLTDLINRGGAVEPMLIDLDNDQFEELGYDEEVENLLVLKKELCRLVNQVDEEDIPLLEDKSNKGEEE